MLAVHEIQCTGYLTDVAEGYGLGKCAALYLVGKRGATYVFHYVVGGVVLLEDVDDADDVLVVECSQCAGFLDEFLAEAVDHIAAAY